MAFRDRTQRGSARRLGVSAALVAGCLLVASTRADGAPGPCTKDVHAGVLTLRAACWLAEPGGYSAAGPVTINGLELRGAGVVRVDTVGGKVQSTESRRWLVGGQAIGVGRFRWEPGVDTWAHASGKLGRLRLTGEVQPVFRARGKAAIDAWVVLPLLSRRFGPITGNVNLQTSSARPFRLAGSRIKVREVRAGRIALRDLSLAYSRTSKLRDVWRGRLRIQLPTEAITSVGGSGSWLDGKLQRVAGEAEGSVPLMSGFTLTSLGVQVRLRPTLRLAGRATVEFGPSVGGDAGLEMRAGVSFRPVSFWRLRGSIGVTGKARDALDAIHAHATLTGGARIQLDQGFLAALDGRLDVGFARARIQGRTSGFVSRRVFNLEGSVKLRMASFDKGAEGLVSSQGLAGCVDLGWFGPTVGMGYRWSASGPDIMFHSCKIDRYRVLTPGDRELTSRAAPSPQPTQVAQVPLPDGLPVEAFAGVSKRGTPNIVVAGPGGVRYDTSEIGDLKRRTVVVRKDVFVWHAVADRTVYVVVRAPAAGLWSVRPSSGSARITRMLAAHGLPDPSVAANVAAGGQGYVLNYELGSLGPQRVSIYEARTKEGAGAVPIVENVGRSGSTAFVPTPLGPRRRYLVAVVSADRAPNELRALGTFVVNPQPPPAAPALTAVRRPDEVVVSWGGTRSPLSGMRQAARLRTAEWLVRDRVSDGRAEMRTLPFGVTTIAVPAEPRHRVEVTVAAIDRWGREGKAARVTAEPIPERPSLDVDVVGGGTVHSAPGGIACPGDCEGSYKGATSVTLTATPEPGWEFTGWSGACTGTGECRVPLTAVRSVKATFARRAPPQQPPAQPPPAPGGSQDAAQAPPPSAVVPPPPTPPTAQPAGPRFTLDLTVRGPGTVTSSPAGVACPGDCDEAYAAGTQVVLTATAAPGSEFEGWGRACLGAHGRTCVVKIDCDVSVKATFEDDDDAIPTFPDVETILRGAFPP
jgi:hypothetical protein